MIHEIQIKNFKAWGDTKSMRLAPLTVLFGANSAGKSSINQFLLALKQTVDSPDRNRVFHFGDKNSLVDLGTFYDIVNDHKENKSIVGRIGWQLPALLKIEDSIHKNSYRKNAILFETEMGLESDRLITKRFAYILTNSTRDEKPITIVYQKKDSGKNGKYELAGEGYDFLRNRGRGWGLPAPVKCYGFPDEVAAYYQNGGFLADLMLEFEKLFRSTYYLGPLRLRPARSYIWSGEVPEHVGYEGERAIEAILAAKDRQISRGYKRKTQPFEQVIARWLQEMGLVHRFEVKPIARHRKEYEVLVKVGTTSSFVNVTDVGFGVSQILPVIVECFYAPCDSTLIFEQPEIHLHPQVQAGLADLFIESIHARERGKERNIQLIVESHSEHFLKRLQRRIAENEITPEEVAVYFCKPSSTGAQLEELEVNLFGDITNWPDNFFGDEMAEIAARTEAAIKRKIESNK
jgi:predicted ATPase